MFIGRSTPPRSDRGMSATPSQRDKQSLASSHATPASDFFPPLDQMGSFSRSSKGTYSVSGPGTRPVVANGMVNDHKLTSSLPRPSPNRPGTLYDTAATRAAKSGVSLSLIDAALSDPSNPARPRSSLTRLEQARQETGDETPRAVREAKSRFAGTAVPEARAIDVHSIQLVVDEPRMPTLGSPAKARVTATPQTARHPSPPKSAAVVDPDFERKLIEAMESGVNPFLDKRKAMMRGGAVASTINPASTEDEWAEIVPDATPSRNQGISTVPSPERLRQQQQQSQKLEDSNAQFEEDFTPRATRTILQEPAVADTIDNPEQQTPENVTRKTQNTGQDPDHLGEVNSNEPQLALNNAASLQDSTEASPIAKIPVRSPEKRIDSFLDTNDDGPSTSELTSKLAGLQIEYESLQKKLQGAQEDAQGWQSEASRLEAELAEAQERVAREAAKAAQLTAPNAETVPGSVEQDAYRRKYEDLKFAYQDLKLSKDQALWAALSSTETGLEALRKAQFELICAKQQASQESAERHEVEAQLTRAVRIAKARGEKISDLIGSNERLEERLKDEIEKNARLREASESAQKNGLKKTSLASTSALTSAKRRANPAAFASDAAPSSSDMEVDEVDADSSFAAHAVKASSRATGTLKGRGASVAASKPSSASTASSSGLRDRIIARAEPQPRKRPVYPVLEDSDKEEEEEEVEGSFEEEEEPENESFAESRPTATSKKASTAPSSTNAIRKAQTTTADSISRTKVASTAGQSSLATKRGAATASTLTASTAASRIRAQEVRTASSPPPSTVATKKPLPIKSSTVASKASTLAAAATSSKAAPLKVSAVEADALDATKKKKRRLLGGGGAGANPLLFGGAGGGGGGASTGTGTSGKKALNGITGAGMGEDEEAENLLNPNLDLPVTLSPVKGFAVGKVGPGGAGGRFQLGKAGGAKSMFG